MRGLHFVYTCRLKSSKVYYQKQDDALVMVAYKTYFNFLIFRHLKYEVLKDLL